MLALFPRCETFAYQRITYSMHVRQTNMSIQSLFFTCAPLLNTFELSDDDPGCGFYFSEDAPTPNTALNFPALKKIVLGACLPLDQLDFSNVQDLHINVYCTSGCVSFNSMGHDLGAIARASPALRKIDLYTSAGLEIATGVDYDFYVGVDSILRPTLHDALIIRHPAQLDDSCCV